MKIIDEFLDEVLYFGIEKAAKLSGISATTIRAWYDGTIPSLENAQKVAFAIGKVFLLFEKVEGDEP